MLKSRRSFVRGLVELLVVAVVALGLAQAVEAFVVKPYRIPSGSMLPTLQIGQRILVDRIGNDFSAPHVGDIVVFHPPRHWAQGCANPKQGVAASGTHVWQACDVAQRNPASVTRSRSSTGTCTATAAARRMPTRWPAAGVRPAISPPRSRSLGVITS